jgi:uncharacterized protein involved in type VI secretion and phage assembly
MNAGQPESVRFYGKYRAVVSKNDDPDGLGRIKARVRAFNDEETAWALPALPFAGPGVGLYLIPPPKTWVWIEYEEGLRWKPVWTGCFWLDDPLDPGRLSGAKPAVKVLKTKVATITIDDDQKAVAIETQDGRVSITSKAVEVTNGQASVKLSGQKVSINGNALEVT